MRRCCVPGCYVQHKLHRVPLPHTSIGKRWYKMCPFLLRYSLIQLENIRICRNHFIHEHIDYEKGRLTKDAIPLINLPPFKPNEEEYKGKKVLEVSPIHPNVPANVKVLNSAQVSTFKTPSTTTKTNENWQVRNLVHLQAEDSHGLPVDHNMYCLPFPEYERHACLFSPCVKCQTPTTELLSDCTNLSIEAQRPGTLVDNNMYCATPRDAGAACVPVEHEHSAEPWSPSECHMQTESVAKESVGYVNGQLWRPIKGEVNRCKISVATQTDDDSQQVCQEMGAGKVLLGSQCAQSYKNMHNNVYVPPAAKVVRTGHQEQTIYFSRNNFIKLTGKSPHQTLESIHAFISSVKEHRNLHFNHEPSQKCNFSTERPCAELNIQSPVIKPAASIVQTLQSTPAPKRTLESLVAELTESGSGKELADVQPASIVMAADTTDSLPNPTFDVAPCPPIVDPPINALYPLASTKEIKRFHLNKENSTPKEQWLYKQLNIIRNKLRNEKIKNKKLKSRLQNLQTKTNPYLKGYPLLTCEAKAFIDTQLRCAGTKPKGVRFNDEEKLFALKLHQISPDCYRFLQQYIKLPNKTTLSDFMKIA